MNLQTWVAICVVVSALLLHRPQVLAYVSLILWVAVPGLSGHLLTGMTVGQGTPIPPVHPVTILSAIALALQFVFRGSNAAAAVGRHRAPVLGLLVVSGFATGQTFLAGSPFGTALMIDQVVGGVFLYVLVLIAAEGNDAVVPRMTSLWVVLAASEGLIGLLVKTGAITQPYESDFKAAAWYVLDTGRQSATLDHPLALALFCATAVPLTAYVRNSLLQLIVLSGIATGVVVSESRTGLLLLVVGIVYLSLSSSQSVGRKFVIAVGAVGGGVYAASTTLFSATQDRFVQDSGSAAARSAARSAFLDNAQTYLVFGDGSGSSYRFAREQGLITSLENGWLMYAIDFGVIAVLILLLALVAPALRAGHRTSPTTASLLVMVTAVASYSSIATDTAAGPAMFMLAGLAASARASSIPLSTRAPRNPSFVPQRA